MNVAICNKILLAIKTNNLVMFSCSIKGNENLAFGRFPLLSLCYLYNAKKIIKNYEHKLCRMTKYRVIEEPLEIYKKFRSVAGRTLRLYTDNNFVTPLEMLAILHKDNLVKNKFKVYENNEEIVKNIKSIYLIYGQKVVISNSFIKINKKHISSYEKKIYKIAFAISLAFVILISGVYSLVGLVYGLGTSIKAFKIYNETQLYQALNSNGNYILNNDIILTKFDNNLNFSGKFNGNNKTIYVNNLPKEGLIENSCGKIENLNIVYSSLEDSINNSLSLLVEKNSGTINKVNISCESLKLNCDKNEEDAIYINAFATTNNGTIENCNLRMNAEVNSNLNGECFVSGFVGINNNTIKNCIFTLGSSVLLAEADGTGFASFNEKNATIINCKNYASLSQTSMANGWSPTIGGITLTNYGLIQNSLNFGNINIVSFNEQESVEGTIFLGGISANNFAKIDKCLNKGNLSVNSKKLIVYLGGISAYSFYYTDNDITNLSVVTNCVSNSTINIQTEHNYAYVFAGGICGYLYGEVSKCYSLSSFINGYNQDKYFIGNCLGSAYVQYQVFGNVICISASSNYMLKQDNVTYQIGSLINSGNIVAVGLNTINGEILTMESAEQIKQQENYWDEE